MAGNGRSGRRRTPTSLKLIRGTYRADRHRREPHLRVTGWPEPPRHLTPRERELWDGLRQHCEAWSAPSDWLAYNGVVSLLDRLLRVQEAMRSAESDALRRLQGLELRLWRELRAYLGLVGLSPIDRARMRVPEPTTPGPLDRFVKKT
jgi:hypothetical protein